MQSIYRSVLYRSLVVHKKTSRFNDYSFFKDMYCYCSDVTSGAILQFTLLRCLSITSIIIAIPRPLRKPNKKSGIPMKNLLKNGAPVAKRQPMANIVLSDFDIFVFLIISAFLELTSHMTHFFYPFFQFPRLSAERSRPDPKPHK